MTDKQLPHHALHMEDKNKGANRFAAILSCTMYSACSIGMVLANKGISMSLPENIRSEVPYFTCILYQAIVAVVLVECAKKFKMTDYPDFDVHVAKSWLPLNCLFVAMLCSGFLALTFVSVPIVTIFKNMANIITVSGDYFFFGHEVTVLTIAAVLVMTFGAIMSGLHDLEFNFWGYFWMVINCFCTASYTLYMRFASTSIKLPKFGMVFYNNLLSIGLLTPICIIMGEFGALLNPEIMTWWFILANTAAGVLGFYLNFASLWCVGATSATTYAIVGSLNKIPLTVFGAVIFGSVITQEGAIFIGMGLLGGFLYAYAKILEKGSGSKK